MKNLLLINLFLITLIFSCKVEELKTPPVVKTNSSSEIASSSAKIWGEVVEEGSSAATERGFVYSDKNPSPSTSDTKVVSGFGKGEFNMVISSLSPKTKYYFKAYASNQSGIAYGDAKDFTTIDDIKLPTLTTNIVTNITISGCTSGGSITSNGGATIIEKGIVYGTTANPTITNNKIISTGGDNYSLVLSGLADNTTYYIRAFATNSKGTNYGDQQVLTTLKNYNSILKNGLVAYYPFNGNANDASGNNLNGILTNTSLTTNRFDINNSAYLFKNSDVYIPFNNKFKVTNLTTSAWIRPSSYNPDNYSIILNRFEEGYNSIGGETWQLILTNNEVWFQVIGEGRSGTAPNTILKASKQVQLNAWSLITSTYDGTNMKVYVNGSLLLSQPTTTKINTLGTSGISIGVSKQANGIWHYFDGKIDDVGIWDRALTAEEIKFLYDNDFKP